MKPLAVHDPAAGAVFWTVAGVWWLGEAVLAFLPPLVAFSWRLGGEERVLAGALGEPYRAYMSRTKRLIPGVW